MGLGKLGLNTVSAGTLQPSKAKAKLWKNHISLSHRTKDKYRLLKIDTFKCKLCIAKQFLQIHTPGLLL